MKCSNDYDCFYGLGSQLYFCCNPLRLDMYNGCSHGCEYCFASTKHSGIAKKQNFFKEIRSAPHNKLKTFFSSNRLTDKDKITNIKALISMRQPLHIGGMSDPFQPIEKTEKCSEVFLKEIIKENRYPAIWSTKGVLVSDYADALKDANSVVQISCIANQSLSIIETGAPSFDERLDAANSLIKKNVPVILRLQPLIYELLDESLYSAQQFIKIGVKSIVVEGLKKNVSLKYMPGMDQIIGGDFLDKFKKIGVNIKGEISYPISVKLAYINKIKKLCKDNNVEFYVGDNDLRHYGDGPNCCGVANIEGYETYNKANLSTVMFKDKFSYENINGDDIFMSSFATDVGMGSASLLKFERQLTYRDRLRNYFNKNENQCVMNTIRTAKPIGLTDKKNVIYQMIDDINNIK